MPIEDRMTIDERRKYLRKMQERYLQAGRKERRQLLDETDYFCAEHLTSNLVWLAKHLAVHGLARSPTHRLRLDPQSWLAMPARPATSLIHTRWDLAKESTLCFAAAEGVIRKAWVYESVFI